MQDLQNNELLGKIILLLFLAWFLYGVLPYIIAGLSIAVVIFIVARFQNK